NLSPTFAVCCAESESTVIVAPGSLVASSWGLADCGGVAGAGGGVAGDRLPGTLAMYVVVIIGSTGAGAEGGTNSALIDPEGSEFAPSKHPARTTVAAPSHSGRREQPNKRTNLLYIELSF